MKRKYLFSIVVFISLILHSLFLYIYWFNPKTYILQFFSIYMLLIGIGFWTCLILYLKDSLIPMRTGLLLLIPLSIEFLCAPLSLILFRGLSMTFAMKVSCLFNILLFIIYFIVIMINYRVKRKPTLIVLAIFSLVSMLYPIISFIFMVIVTNEFVFVYGFYSIINSNALSILRDIALLIFLIIEIRSHIKNNQESITL